MRARDRHHLILAKLAASEHVDIETLPKALGVSRETIRRDVLELEAQSKLRRLHGGIARIDARAESPFEDRLKVNATHKRRMALRAARLVQPGMLIAIDSGTTTLAFAAAIAGLPDVCVVTNSVEIARVLLAARREAEVILLGGRVSGDVPGTFGELTISQMRRFSPDLGVFSPVAISGSEGATNFHLVEAEFAKAMVERSRHTVVLADHSKLGVTSRVHVCDCRQIGTLVTDRLAPKDAVRELTSGGIRDVMVD
jgi:DeoR/GlpR family transcriptional regulator of sugar metabolism